MWLTLGRKTVFVYIYPFYWYVQKELFKQIQIFQRICPFQTWLEKQISEYFSAGF